MKPRNEKAVQGRFGHEHQNTRRETRAGDGEGHLVLSIVSPGTILYFR